MCSQPFLSYEQGNDFTEGLKCHHFIRAQQQQHTLTNKLTNKQINKLQSKPLVLLSD